MKKRILILMSSLILIFTATYANTTGDKIPEKVSSVFNHDFYFASNVNWEMVGDYYKSSFIIHDKIVFAFYTAEGEFMGIATNLPAVQLPSVLRNQLKKDFRNYWISDLFVLSNGDSHDFYVTMENADQKIILKAVGIRGWEFYKTTKKP